MQATIPTQKNQGAHRPKSAHATTVAEQYVEQRKAKAATQAKAEKGLNKLLGNSKKREYVIL